MKKNKVRNLLGLGLSLTMMAGIAGCGKTADAQCGN